MLLSYSKYSKNIYSLICPTNLELTWLKFLVPIVNLHLTLKKNYQNTSIEDIKKIFTKIQNDLFAAGSDLSNPNLNDSKNRVTDEMVKFLEEKIDSFENELSPITNFILPGGKLETSLVHISRAITRRAETNVIALSEKEKINNFCLVYLNRLSDLLFVIARTINKRNGINDIIWKP